MQTLVHRLETLWLNLLRTLVVIASALLLVAMAAFGLASLQGFGDGPDDKLPVPRVSSESLLQQMTAQPVAATEPADAEVPGTDADAANRAHFDRATVAIVTFIAKHSNGAETADRDAVYAIIESRAHSQGSPEMVSGYAKGFAEAIEPILDSPAVQKQAETSSALAIVNRALDLYSADFERQLEASRRELTGAQQEHLQSKADAAHNMYLALACFGLFLCIVFLSIFIRIERNLRHLEGRERSSLLT